MIQVQMTKDIRQFEAKTLGPLTTRQLIAIVICAAIAVPVAIFVPGDLIVKILIGTVIMIPAFFISKKNFIGGLSFERFLLRVLYKNVLTPPKRKIIKNSLYTDIRKELRKQEEKEFYESLSKKEKKLYDKNKNFVKYDSEEKIYL